MIFKRIAIVGVGLIGGSIGMAARKKKLAGEVVGICRRKISADRAIKSKACDRVELDLGKGLEGADLVIIASPVGKILGLAKEIVNNSTHEFILTDVGSTKSLIVRSIERLVPKRIKFVGAHPMAGSEKAGVLAARSDLFGSSACIITRTGSTDMRAMNKLRKFWLELGAVCDVMDPEAHDRRVSDISHLPHVVSFALAAGTDPKSLKYAANGFRDTTRIASSDPELWADIFLTNTKELERSIAAYKISLLKIEKALKLNDRQALVSVLKKANRTMGMLGRG